MTPDDAVRLFNTIIHFMNKKGRRFSDTVTFDDLTDILLDFAAAIEEKED